eukprot:TRINITY_DN31156_c0_g1_i1.p1 TRINITY_DN31156_c0_g1~~TRINITY_DN31156_c0_g1_i1.p1  ORF type:complete len:433 (-),score=73.10 TRINITY_DN31156_c0_g1_i1:428-1726(-)
MRALPVLLLLRLGLGLGMWEDATDSIPPRSTNRGPIQNRTCFSAPCADALAQCLDHPESCGILIRDSATGALDLSSLSEVAESPRNRHWRRMKRCFDFNCAEGTERACSEKTPSMALHLPGGACAHSPCHLTNDFALADSAGECRRRCFDHSPPDFNESCSAWSWGARSGSKDFQQCFLMQHTPVPQRNRQFVSGACHGGPGRSDDQVAAEKHLCEHIMENSNNLRVWLKVRKQISLPETAFNDLYTYMDVLHLCPDGEEFEQAVGFFTPPPPAEDTLLESIFMVIMTIVDFVSDNFKLIASVTTILLPVLLPLICSVLGWLCICIPVLERVLVPILPGTLKDPLKKHIEAAHSPPNDQPAPAESESQDAQSAELAPHELVAPEDFLLQQPCSRSGTPDRQEPAPSKPSPGQSLVSKIKSPASLRHASAGIF